MTNTARTLTPEQHQGLDRLAEKDPTALVVGWDEKCHGPVVLLRHGAVRAVNASTGRLNKVRA